MKAEPPVEPVQPIVEPCSLYAGELGDFIQLEADLQPQMEVPIPLPVVAKPGPITQQRFQPTLSVEIFNV